MYVTTQFYLFTMSTANYVVINFVSQTLLEYAANLGLERSQRDYFMSHKVFNAGDTKPSRLKRRD